MAKPELGAKRQCQACAAKFFDFNRDPVICPKCGTVFQGVTARAERATAKDEESDDEPANPAGVEIVSLDEVGAAEEKSADPVADDIDVEDDESPEDAFLEEEEEDEDDVSSLIDGEIAPDEEP
ncbi:MAG TPA: TIGR02300 family protein [Roseiarcus sp.]|nr:TIGR02300 family protein [Roseiarcus sp.]